MILNRLRFILLDIEGTCSDISFVKNVLFPYSARELRNFLSSNRNNPTVASALKTLNAKSSEDEIGILQKMIHDDVKHPALKTLQGMIWKKGFESGEFKAPLYDDVLPALMRWKHQGLRLGVYSSGSVTAQKLFWGFTEHGNLLEYFSAFFDLDIGGKKDADSYSNIAASLELPAEEILFLSDLTDEVKAALTAGLAAIQIIRNPKETLGPGSAHDFTQISG